MKGKGKVGLFVSLFGWFGWLVVWFVCEVKVGWFVWIGFASEMCWLQPATSPNPIN